jgi:dihydroxyacetone kinase phosphotransfer subunit
MAGSAGGAESLDAPAFAAALRAGLDGVVARGRAQAGDKTMYDALSPACDALDNAVTAGKDLGHALSIATAAADAGRKRHDPDAGAEGSGVLPRRAQRGTPGPRRNVGRAADLHRGTGAVRGRVAVTGLVVVSHSRALAEAAVSLAAEMLHGSDVRIAVAAGLDATTFGTDATAIVKAIEAADDGAGVVVLMDLGSAVLSAEMALDMVDPDVRERAVLCAAPLVEGLVVAAVAAAGGATPSEGRSRGGRVAGRQAGACGRAPAGPIDRG